MKNTVKSAKLFQSLVFNLQRQTLRYLLHRGVHKVTLIHHKSDGMEEVVCKSGDTDSLLLTPGFECESLSLEIDMTWVNPNPQNPPQHTRGVFTRTIKNFLNF